MASRDFYSDGVERDGRPDGVRDECARAALALTALFDGEANETDTRLAQSHLEACAQCAWLWQSWTRTRFVLRRMPVPEVPSTLLMRVLLAVRLLAFSRPGSLPSLPSFAPQSKSSEARDARILSETIFLSGTNPFASRRIKKAAIPEAKPLDLPPLDPTLPPPPADLTARILQQTSQKDAPNHVEESAPVVETSSVEPPVFAAEVVFARKHSWISARSFSAAMVPALAAWLFVVARAPHTGEIASVEQPSLAAAAPMMPRLNRAKNTGMLRRITSLRRFATLPAVSRASLPESGAMQPREVEENEQFDTSAPLMAREIAPATERETAAANPPLMAALPKDASSAATPGVTQAQPAAATALPQAKAAPKVTQRAPAISMVSTLSRTRRPEWNAPASSVSDERAAEWKGAARHAMTPATGAEAREEDVAPDAAEILDHVAQLSDSRPDDVRNVLDDFRASLLVSSGEETTTPPVDGQKS